MDCWEESHQKPYDFLMLDFRKMKAYRNLTQVLYSKEDFDKHRYQNNSSGDSDDE